MLGRREFGFLVVAGAATLGCRREDNSKPSDPFAPDAPAILEFSLPSVFELVEPGSEPRERLRYAERVPMRRIELAAWELEYDESPPMTMIVAWAGVEPQGDARRHTYEVVDLEGPRAASVPEWRDLAGQALGTARGIDRVIQTRGIKAAPNPGEFIDTLAVLLPEEPIGRGAVWTCTQENRGDLSVAGSQEREIIEWTTTRRYTLVERRGDTLLIDYTVTSVTDKPQRVPGGVTTSGRLVVELSDPLPQSGDLEVVDSVNSWGIRDEPIRSRIRLRTRE